MDTAEMVRVSSRMSLAVSSASQSFATLSASFQSATNALDDFARIAELHRELAKAAALAGKNLLQ